MLLPARLRLEPRVEKKAGETHRFVVPVIDIDVSFRTLMGSSSAEPRAALPAGYTPIAPSEQAAPSLADGLAETQRAALTRTSRSAAPVPEIPSDPAADEFEGPIPVVDETAPPPSSRPALGSGGA